MSYLMIANPGEAPIEGFLLMGATTKDPSDTDTIGMFGTGTKYSVASLLRENVYPIVCSGTVRMEWTLNPIRVGNTSHKEVMVSIGGKAPRSTGTTLAMGQHGWAGVSIALREFISNALDSVGGLSSGVKLEIVDKPRASRGETRVFIPWRDGPEGQKGLDDFLQNWFLHWRQDINPKLEGPILKLNPDSPARFYRRGVLIRVWGQGENSLWDYNFTSLNLDEARKATDWDLQYQAARILSRNPKAFASTLQRISSTPGLWESKFSQYGLDVPSDQKESIQAEVSKVLGSRILADNPEAARMAANKGIQTLLIPRDWVQACESAGLATVATILDDHARLGREPGQPALEMTDRASKWIRIIRAAGLAGPGSSDPEVFGFRQHPNSPAPAWGYCRWPSMGDPGIYLNYESSGELLDQAILEELCHWYSGERDFTRGFQEWLLRLACRAIQELEGIRKD